MSSTSAESAPAPSAPDLRAADRFTYLDLTRIQMRLASEARGMHAVAASQVPAPDMQEYADRRAAILRSGYERMGVELAALADDAKAKADVYFGLLTGENV